MKNSDDFIWFIAGFVIGSILYDILRDFILSKI